MARCVIALTYVPGVGDPTGDNLHWVQVIRTNLPTDFGTANGQTKPDDPGFTYSIDDGYGPGVPGNPYYDSGYAADDTTFIDRPSRPIPEERPSGTAEAFLVQRHHDRIVNGKTFHVRGGPRRRLLRLHDRRPRAPSSVILTVIALGSVALARLLRKRLLRPAT